MSVVEAVTQKQKELGLNKSELAEKMGINRMTLHFILSGQRNPKNSKVFYSAVISTFPDLTPFVNIEMGAKSLIKNIV